MEIGGRAGAFGGDIIAANLIGLTYGIVNLDHRRRERGTYLNVKGLSDVTKELRTNTCKSEILYSMGSWTLTWSNHGGCRVSKQ